MPKDARTIANTPVDEIRRIVRENEYRLDQWRKKQLPRVCPVCEITFTAQRKDHIFCTDYCRIIWFKLKRQLLKEKTGQ